MNSAPISTRREFVRCAGSAMAWLAVSRRGRAQTLDTISGDDPAALTVVSARR